MEDKHRVSNAKLKTLQLNHWAILRTNDLTERKKRGENERG